MFWCSFWIGKCKSEKKLHYFSSQKCTRPWIINAGILHFLKGHIDRILGDAAKVGRWQCGSKIFDGSDALYSITHVSKRDCLIALDRNAFELWISKKTTTQTYMYRGEQFSLFLTVCNYVPAVNSIFLLGHPCTCIAYNMQCKRRKHSTGESWEDVTLDAMKGAPSRRGDQELTKERMGTEDPI